MREGNREEAEGKHKAATRAQPLPLSLLEQLQDADNDVIDVTKARSLEESKTPTALGWDQHRAQAPKTHKYPDLPHYLKLFGMMETPCPVYGNVTDLGEEREVSLR